MLITPHFFWVNLQGNRDKPLRIILRPFTAFLSFKGARLPLKSKTPYNPLKSKLGLFQENALRLILSHSMAFYFYPTNDTPTKPKCLSIPLIGCFKSNLNYPLKQPSKQTRSDTILATPNRPLLIEGFSLGFWALFLSLPCGHTHTRTRTDTHTHGALCVQA